jgi:hypothetical protein
VDLNPLTLMPAQTIDEVIAQLDVIIKRAREEASRLGYFATLYRNVTIKVKEGIATGMFEDGARMERLDVIFANRYLAALEAFQLGEKPSHCWLVAFETSGSWSPIILQHLLAGMNAHINFDLGIAAQAVAPAEQLESLRHDFDQINNVLGAMIAKVRSDVEEVSPWIRFLDRWDPKGQSRFISFSLDKARSSSWLTATIVNITPADHLSRKLRILDDGVAVLGSLIARPQDLLFRLALRAIRLRESSDVRHVIDVLSQV